MVRRAQWIVAVLVYSVCALLSVSCARRTPELMAITGLNPVSVTENDLITLKGEGFVLGPEANVRLLGSVFRPGQETENIEARLSGSAVDGENLEVVVTSVLIEQLCGSSGDGGVSHATFRGDVEAAYAPRTKGAPPIVGRVRGIELDVFRTVPVPLTESVLRNARTPTSESERSQGHAPETLGFGFATNTTGGLTVTSVDEGKAAARAGLRIGDVLQRWSGVRVFSGEDIAVYPGQRYADVRVVRAGHATPMELKIGVAGLSPLGAKGWNTGLVLLGVLIVGVMVSRSSVSQWLVWLAVASPRGRPAESRTYGVVPFLGVSAAFVFLALRRDAVPFELDLALVALLSFLGLAFCGVGQAYQERGFSLRALFRVWLGQVPLHLALAIAITALVLERGQASVWGLAAAQGLNPLTYGAFASPPSFLVAIVWASASVAVAIGGRRGTNKTPRLLRAFTSACGDTASLAIAAMLLAVFFGGWSTTNAAPEHLGWSQALYFQLRFTVLFLALGLLRSFVPSPPAEAIAGWAWKVLLPIAVGALLLLPVWWASIWPTWVRVGTKGFLLGVAAIIALGLPLSALLLRRLANVGRRTGLNPWL
jgi:hypothetical protein